MTYPCRVCASLVLAIFLQTFAAAGGDPPSLLTSFGSKTGGPVSPPFPPMVFGLARDAAVDSSGNIYIVDDDLDRVQKVTSSGTFITEWGTSGTGPGQFSIPVGIAVSPADHVYVVDQDLLATRVQVFDSAGNFLQQWGSFGLGVGEFAFPQGIDVGDDLVYVADGANRRVQVFDLLGSPVDSWNYSTSDPSVTSFPYDVAVSPSGDVFVAFSDLDGASPGPAVRRHSETGAILGAFGTFDAVAGDGVFCELAGIAVDSFGDVYLSDSCSSNLQALSAAGSFLWRIQVDVPPFHSGPGNVFPGGVTVGSDQRVVLAGLSTQSPGAWLLGEAPLTLAADVDKLSPGDDLTLRFFGGEPSQPMALFLTAVNGAPVVDLLVLALLDAHGAWTASAPAPLQPGDDFSLLAFSIENGFVLPTNQITIEIQ